MSTFLGLRKTVLLALCCLQVAQSLPVENGHAASQLKDGNLDIGKAVIDPQDVSARLETNGLNKIDEKSTGISSSGQQSKNETGRLAKIENLDTQGNQEEIDAWKSAQETFHKYFENIYPSGLEPTYSYAGIPYGNFYTAESPHSGFVPSISVAKPLDQEQEKNISYQDILKLKIDAVTPKTSNPTTSRELAGRLSHMMHRIKLDLEDWRNFYSYLHEELAEELKEEGLGVDKLEAKTTEENPEK
ncbi:uncharacterized protein PGTG_05062 [Puccinia graminis f. sp. tritici CRL 75-36-700-3]|uniref:Uncharacterized protein n=1 Tax=Puccinia graminis f. sp. tritici (strain CRL 75-36-700-3 / race SCCL) TaxID=418459 RepID=E3K6A6_PUCGT|nr:uncharacterized protein PGTG_05062 [Puccinia graminis f. sp. tritici CRL 75-36-700-3]EFP79837.2 hypothetical protein PGTG_05062 [Puccinia graminis f. sp. tritici CRL 75-36-700-3]